MKNLHTTLLGYVVAAFNAAAAFLQANGDWSHLNYAQLGASVAMAIWGHLQADSK